MSTQIYVAGKFSEANSAKAVASELEKLGYSISKKWWEFDQGDPRTRSPEITKMVGEKELEGCIACDVMVCFLTHKDYAYRGTLTEMGIFLGARKFQPGKHLIIVTPKGASNLDYGVLRVPHVATADDFIEFEGKDWTKAVPLIARSIRHVHRTTTT